MLSPLFMLRLLASILEWLLCLFCRSKDVPSFRIVCHS
uniref:Uncharacterized protein n=1 Tax=Arundo donax TaxID=35708 RepID=A0A0A9C0M8_ARUDO